jgi:hypothetical protein
MSVFNGLVTKLPTRIARWPGPELCQPSAPHNGGLGLGVDVLPGRLRKKLVVSKVVWPELKTPAHRYRPELFHTGAA